MVDHKNTPQEMEVMANIVEKAFNIQACNGMSLAK